jgi:hypothetical protein
MRPVRRVLLTAALAMAGVLSALPAHSASPATPATPATMAAGARPGAPVVGGATLGCGRMTVLGCASTATSSPAPAMRWWCDAEPGSAPTGMTFQQAAGKASPKALPRPDGLGPNPNPPPTPIECGMAFPNGWVVYNRYHQCTVQQVTLTVTRVPPGTVIGVGQVQVIHHITSHPRDRQWTDDVYLNMYQASEVMVSGASIFPYFDWTPLSSVRQISETPPPNWVPLLLNQQLYGRWTLGADQTSNTVIATDQFHFIFQHIQAQTSATVDIVDSQQLRCDSLRIWGSPAYNNGCVFRIFTPTLTFSRSDTAIPEAAQHIYDAQRSLADHWGWRDNGPPLHRLVDPARRRQNHDIACAGFVPDPGDQCDEYPSPPPARARRLSAVTGCRSPASSRSTTPPPGAASAPSTATSG